jgi:hypothetical protein
MLAIPLGVGYELRASAWETSDCDWYKGSQMLTDLSKVHGKMVLQLGVVSRPKAKPQQDYQHHRTNERRSLASVHFTTRREITRKPVEFLCREGQISGSTAISIRSRWFDRIWQTFLRTMLALFQCPSILSLLVFSSSALTFDPYTAIVYPRASVNATRRNGSHVTNFGVFFPEADSFELSEHDRTFCDYYVSARVSRDHCPHTPNGNACPGPRHRSPQSTHRILRLVRHSPRPLHCHSAIGWRFRASR